MQDIQRDFLCFLRRVEAGESFLLVSGEHALAEVRPVAAPCRQLLRAAYLGTLLAAATVGRTRVVLTLIGGGVFGNPIPLIWDAIGWALDEVQPYLAQNLDVVLNGRALGTVLDLDAVILPELRRRGGVILSFNAEGCTGIRR